MNTVYLPSRLLAIENDMFNRTVTEMANEYTRWGDPNNVPAQVDAFYQYHLIFQEDLLCRPENMRNHIQTNFNLPQQVNVQLNVYPQNAGKIEIAKRSLVKTLTQIYAVHYHLFIPSPK